MPPQKAPRQTGHDRVFTFVPFVYPLATCIVCACVSCQTSIINSSLRNKETTTNMKWNALLLVLSHWCLGSVLLLQLATTMTTMTTMTAVVVEARPWSVAAAPPPPIAAQSKKKGSPAPAIAAKTTTVVRPVKKAIASSSSSTTTKKAVTKAKVVAKPAAVPMKTTTRTTASTNNNSNSMNKGKVAAANAIANKGAAKGAVPSSSMPPATHGKGGKGVSVKPTRSTTNATSITTGITATTSNALPPTHAKAVSRNATTATPSGGTRAGSKKDATDPKAKMLAGDAKGATTKSVTATAKNATAMVEKNDRAKETPFWLSPESASYQAQLEALGVKKGAPLPELHTWGHTDKGDEALRGGVVKKDDDQANAATKTPTATATATAIKAGKPIAHPTPTAAGNTTATNLTPSTPPPPASSTAGDVPPSSGNGAGDGSTTTATAPPPSNGNGGNDDDTAASPMTQQGNRKVIDLGKGRTVTVAGFNGDTTNAIEKAERRSRSMAEHALRVLDENRGRSAAYQRYFQPQELERVRTLLQRSLDHRHVSITPANSGSPNIIASATSPVGSTNGRGYINVNVKGPFRRLDAIEQAVTFLHERTHLYGTDDVRYGNPVRSGRCLLRSMGVPWCTHILFIHFHFYLHIG